MRYSLLLFMPTIILSSCSTFISPEKLARDVFKAFQEEKVDIALDYLLYEEDYVDFFSQATISQKEKNRLILKHTKKAYLNKMEAGFRKRFDEIIEAGKNAGIVWIDTKFEYTIGPNRKEFKGVQADEIYIVFSYQNKLFKIQLDDCYKCKRGWLMSDEPIFKGRVDD